MIGYLIIGITYAFAAAAQPGPLQAYLISQALSRGWKRTLPAAFSPLLSDIPISILILFLLSGVRDNLLLFLRCAGGIFLLYLSARSFITWKNFNDSKAGKLESSKQTLFNAAFVNLLNPNPYIGWSLIMGPLFLKGWRESAINGIFLLLGFYFTMVISLIGIIILFSFAKNLGAKVNKAALGLSAAALFCFGVYQLCAVFNLI